jgi:predicted 3-demethylubiquinone-9 3-methyltransferase (glyoxalase superfamily)
VESQCGWLKDRFCLSWQVVPRALGTMMADPDPARVARVAAAFMPMRKLDLAVLEAAYRGA